MCFNNGFRIVDKDVYQIGIRRQLEKEMAVFLPGESHGQRSLAGYSPRGFKELDRSERLHFHLVSLHILSLGWYHLHIRDY